MNVVLMIGIDTQTPVDKDMVSSSLDEIQVTIESLVQKSADTSFGIKVRSELSNLVFGYMDQPILTSSTGFGVMLSEFTRWKTNHFSLQSRIGRYFSLSTLLDRLQKQLSQDGVSYSRTFQILQSLMRQLFVESIERPLMKQMISSEDGIISSLKLVMRPLTEYLDFVVVENATRSDLVEHLWSDSSVAAFWVGHGSVGNGVFQQKLLDSAGNDVAAYFSKVGKRLRYLGLVSCGSLSTVVSSLSAMAPIPKDLRIGGSDEYTLPQYLFREFFLMFRHLNAMSEGAWRDNRDLYQYLSLETSSLANSMREGYFLNKPERFPKYEIRSDLEGEKHAILIKNVEGSLLEGHKLTIISGGLALGVWNASAPKPIMIPESMKNRIFKEGLSVEALSGAELDSSVNIEIKVDGQLFKRWEDSSGNVISDGLRQMYFM